MPPSRAPAPPAAHAARTPRASFRAAALVAAVWTVSAVPVLLGVSRCPVAQLLHQPCPGCGMTRAIELLLHGELGASLAMHPLAVPTLLVQLVFAALTVLVTLRRGTPFVLWEVRAARVTVYVAAIVFGLDLLLWIARFYGAFHGPVPV
jgi:uncharacterized protein DUF2752